MITVFTPTYNRAYTLGRLYQSLCAQASKEFVWLIVDDGSEDNTKELVESWILENKIEISYFYQENMGKSAAHNKGVELTRTELFTCVDSDDYLSENAIEDILAVWNRIQTPGIIGILAFCGYADGSVITKYSLADETTGKLLDLYRNEIISGDTKLIYRTELLKKVRFPMYENEKFVPEAFLYDLLDEEGELYVFPRIVCIVEYLPDGYTHNMAKLIADNPRGYQAWIRQRLKKDIRLKERFGDLIRYISISIVIGEKGIVKGAPYPIVAAAAYLPGCLFYLMRYKKLIKEKKRTG